MNGPKLPSTDELGRCSAARQTCRSLQAQSRADGELVVCGQGCHWTRDLVATIPAYENAGAQTGRFTPLPRYRS